MIQYSLICENSHKFEAWFKSSLAFDEQAALGIVSCPLCNVSKVSKALMAPSVGAKSNSADDLATGSTEQIVSSSGQAGDKKQSLTVSSGHPDQEKLQKIIRKLREKITAESDYVGKDFAVEARKIHEEESKARSIYGEATPDETAALIEDGVEIIALPTLPEEQN
ncbi:MAG: DUF1178 family protein [Devosiaceae bacterium]|nr:DUF1178 family protein [Devosiaceae bacterium]